MNTVASALARRRTAASAASAMSSSCEDRSVAVLNGSGEPEIQAGDVGTIVELFPPDGLEVEFPSRDGRTRHVGTLSIGDVLVLNRERTRVA